MNSSAQGFPFSRTEDRQGKPLQASAGRQDQFTGTSFAQLEVMKLSFVK
jgi:hypothetical protein